MRNPVGFTLIELIMVLSVLAILSSIAIPNGLSWIKSSRLGDAGRQVLLSIQDARIYSIKANATTRIEFSETENSYKTEKWNPDIDDWNIKTHTLPAGVQMDATFGSGRVLTYNSRGGLVSPMGNVTLTNSSGRTIRITVNINGNARMADD
jgi:prepilin-type N-terminal cleavage/methylation domain-containing protein